MARTSSTSPLLDPDTAEALDVDVQTPSLGPGDSSDSGNDVPAAYQGRDSDSRGTGDRAGADPLENEVSADDADTDREVSADEAGVSRSAPNPVRNGG